MAVLNIASVLIATFIFFAALFALALFAEKASHRGRALSSHPVVYALSLTVYCTTWTFYGSVELAAGAGPLFLAVYLGPTLAMILAPVILGRMVRVRNAFRITSMTDFLSARYGKSQLLGGVATALLVIGIIPYIALQIKALIRTSGVVSSTTMTAATSSSIGISITIAMILLTITFGIRRITPTERHPGVISIVAATSIVKLVAFIAAGVYITYFMFNGPGDILRRVDSIPRIAMPSAGTWLGYLVLSFAAFLFLPRQFHVSVIENSSQRSIGTAMWLVPVYLLAINLFVFPIAIAGLAAGLDITLADSYVLRLPLMGGHAWLSLLVFLGGVSAAIGMIIVETMTMATMVTNQLLIPAFDWYKRFAIIRKNLLITRWLVATVLILAAYGWTSRFGDQYELVDMGLISFVAVLQFAPALLGGLYWRGANKTGVLIGISFGFAIWAYTLIIPEILRVTGHLNGFLSTGPFGIEALRPTHLFGWRGDNIFAHTVFWSLLFNISGYILGSLRFRASADEERNTERMLAVMNGTAAPLPAGAAGHVDLRERRRRIELVFDHYFGSASAAALASKCIAKAGITDPANASLVQIAELRFEVERTLASVIGTAAAAAALKKHDVLDSAEEATLAAAYAAVLAEMRIPATELKKRIDYHKERERMLDQTAQSLRIVADASTVLATSLDLPTTLRSVVHMPIPALAQCSLLYLTESPPRFTFGHGDASQEARINQLLQTLPPGSATLSRIDEAIKTREQVSAVPDSIRNWPVAGLNELDLRASVTVPLIIRSKVIGTLSLFSDRADELEGPDRLALIQELCRRFALAIDNAQLYQEAQRDIRSREELLSIASHELKTPLTPLTAQIQLLISMLRNDKISQLPRDKLEGLLSNAERQLLRLSRLVTELLDLSRIATGRLQLTLERFDLAETIREITGNFEPELKAAGCPIELNLQSGADGLWDRTRIEEVYSNLLANAIKYAPGSLIEVTLKADPRHVIFSVRDHGKGIDPVDRDKIFERFVRGTTAKKGAGFGIGLYLCRQIVVAHGGQVCLDSRPGQGAEFVVSLPRTTQALQYETA